MIAETTIPQPPVESTRKTAAPRWLFASGAIVYAVSFALPAVTLTGTPGPTLSGWDCARFVTLFAVDLEHFNLPLFAGALINPLALLFCILRRHGVRPKLRRILAIAALACIPMTWYVIGHEMKIGIGHIAWVAGLLMLLFPEAAGIVGRNGSR